VKRLLPLAAALLLLRPGFPAQSLADHARQEGERRKEVDRRGVAAKTFRNADIRPGTSGSAAAIPPTRAAPASAAPEKGRTLRSFRAAISSLERSIRQEEEKLGAARRRLELEVRRERLPSRRASPNTQSDRLRETIRELDRKILRLRAERRAVYEEGLRAGWQPGELDGHAILR